MTLMLKDPDSVLDYSVDWGAEYLAGDVLTESGWTVTPAEAGGLSICRTASTLNLRLPRSAAESSGAFTA